MVLVATIVFVVTALMISFVFIVVVGLVALVLATLVLDHVAFANCM